MTYYYGSLGTQYTLALEVWLISQNVQANSSVVGWALTVRKNTGTGFYSLSDPAPWSANINGNTPSGETTYDFRAYSALTLGSGSYTVPHNNDGTKSISVSGSFDPEQSDPKFQPGSASGTFTLPTIARATQPTVTPSPATIGSTVTINTPRASSGFTHDITWSSGTQSGTIATGVATSTTWTVPDVMDEYPDRNQAPIVISVDTRNGGSSIGVRTVTLLARETPTYTQPGTQVFPFDLRARLVTFEGGTWQARRTIPATSIQLLDSHSATATCTLTVSKLAMPDIEDYSIVDIEVQDGIRWLSTGLRFVLSRVQDDDVDPSETATYEGVNFVDFNLGMAYAQKEYKWETPVSPGTIITTIFNDAKARGWGPRMAVDFTASMSSLETPWANTAARDVPQGTPLSQVLEGLVEDGLVEYCTDYIDNQAILQVFNPGTGSDWAVAGADPVVDLTGKPLTSAPRRGSIEDRVTRVTVAGDGELRRTRERAADDSDVFGHLEGWLAASGITDAGEADRIGDHALDDARTPTSERTFVFNANAVDRHMRPYFSMRPGDWILVPDTKADNPAVRSRIAQITLTRSPDGDTSVSVMVGDRILSGTGALAKRQQAQTGGAIPGGSLSNPSGLDSSIPSAPVIDTVTSEGYWDSDGAARSAVTFSWAAVTESMAGGAIGISYYEIWWRPNVGTPWSLRTMTDETEVIMPNWDVLESIQLRVRARSAAGIFGAWSLFEEHVTAAPAVDLDGPQIADIYTDGLGSIYIVWAGVLGSDPAPARLAYVVAEVSTDDGTTYTTQGTPISGPGTIVLNMGNVWGDYLVRLRGYDRLGNAGDVSDPELITLTDPQIDPRIPLPPTNLTSTAGASWNEAGTLPIAWFDLEWDAPTEDTEGDPIGIIGYDVWGLRSTESVPRFITSSNTTSVKVPVGNSETWTFDVRAISDFGGVSAPSDSIQDTADATISTAAAPSAPTLSQYAGILTISWSGVGMVPQIKYVYATISTSSGGTYSRVGMPLNGAGDVVVTGLAPDTEYYAKIVMVDEAGQTSTSPAAGPILLLPITGVTIQTSPVANTGIKMTDAAFTAYDEAGVPTFVLNAATGEVWIAPYEDVFAFGAPGHSAETGDPVSGLAISNENSSFNTYFFASGMQIRNDQEPLSWWEADAADANLVNFHSPRAVIGQRLRVGDYELLREGPPSGPSRLVVRYKGA